ncbi:hypothetical protein BKA69DRAFT_606722 [Paraphysoderma sedebokerense]|nr:hypothetical protein BKA69DRAFT_606722 [Paraphysoderma sedebokerense]
MPGNSPSNQNEASGTFLSQCFEASISGVFERLHDPGLLLPSFQRPYQWKKENVAKLMNDVDLAFKRGGSELEYFIGSIVLVPDETGQNYYIVDGQQRL